MGTASALLLADMWDTNGHMGGGWWIVMMLWMVFFWGAVVYGIVWVVHRGTSSQSSRPLQPETPLQTLDRRFAEGAISVDDYHERRGVLTGRPDATATDTREPDSNQAARRRRRVARRSRKGAASRGEIDTRVRASSGCAAGDQRAREHRGGLRHVV